jgi:hypothetical protein
MGPYLLPDDRPTAQRYHDFLETVLPWLHEGVPLDVRQRLWFQHDRATAHYEERCLAVVECNISRKVDWTSRADFSPDLTPMDFSL